MIFEFLNFLKYPAFVIIWYIIGIIGVLWVIYDVSKNNIFLDKALKIGWPIIIFFFSILGLVLYFTVSRPNFIKGANKEENKQVFKEYATKKWKRVMASAIHCVSGDGLGIISAMVISRFIGLSFWPEFWLEYAVGFAFGWFIFQYIGMRNMSKSRNDALWKAGRAEFFSMITVMLGMGIVMRFVTPAVTGTRPLPYTFEFWSFAALGLLVGFIFTYPMNWWLVSIGWKHGQGHAVMEK